MRLALWPFFGVEEAQQGITATADFDTIIARLVFKAERLSVG